MTTRFGPLVSPAGTRFRLFAPQLGSAEVVIRGGAMVPMTPAGDGFLECQMANCPPGTRYKFRVGTLEFPDLASRQQDDDTNGWSIVREPMRAVEPTKTVRPWHEAVICEVHIGTVTPEGTYAGLMDRLEHFRDAGYTVLELMPVNEFPGRRNWGYDGTLIFAPETAYGTPEELRALVDRAHRLGLGMVLDVVFNHFGSDDNYVAQYASEWFDESIETPWGAAVDFSNESIRQFYFENARMWLTEYDFDGLRLDAVHEIKTDGSADFLADFARVCRNAKPAAWLIAENEQNRATLLARGTGDHDPLAFTAQWNDDIHHVLNFLATNESRDGYEDRTRDPIADLEKGLADGFVHDGDAGKGSDGRTRGEPGSWQPPTAYIAFLQDHDQIGNRPDGKRLPDRVSPRKLDFLQLVVLLNPQIPMFFMGEEASIGSLFPYFVDLDESLAIARRQGREEAMKSMYVSADEAATLPDPNAEATFLSAKIPWDEYGQEERQAGLQRFQTLTRWRRELVWPLLATNCQLAKSARQGNALIVNWLFDAGTLSMALNPTDQVADMSCLVTDRPVTTGDFDQNGEVLRLAPWSAVGWVNRG